MDNWSGPQAKAYKCIAGIALPPLQTRTAGPADKLKKQDDDDVLDEALAYIRNDSLVRRWVVDEPSEKLLVYLSRFIGQGLAELQQAATLAEGQQALRRIAQQPVPVPGERGFALEGITERPQTGADTELLRGYLRQCREELCLRLLEVFYTPAGTQSRYWLDVAGRAKKFQVVFDTFDFRLSDEHKSIGPLHYNDSTSRS